MSPQAIARTLSLCVLLSTAPAGILHADSDDSVPPYQGGTTGGLTPSSVTPRAAVAAESNPHAIALGAYLLSFSVKAGSVLDAKMSVIGIEQHNGRSFIGYRLDSGIVYQEATVSPAQRLARIWTDIVEPAARKLASVPLPADGIALYITFHYGSFTSRADIQRLVQAHQLHSTEAVFYVLTNDATRLNAGEISAGELASKTAVYVNGKPMPLNLQDSGA